MFYPKQTSKTFFPRRAGDDHVCTVSVTRLNAQNAASCCAARHAMLDDALRWPCYIMLFMVLCTPLVMWKDRVNLTIETQMARIVPHIKKPQHQPKAHTIITLGYVSLGGAHISPTPHLSNPPPPEAAASHRPTSDQHFKRKAGRPTGGPCYLPAWFAVLLILVLSFGFPTAQHFHSHTSLRNLPLRPPSTKSPI